MAYPLEPTPEQAREMGETALAYLERFYRELPDAPAQDLEGALELAREIAAAPPAEGGTLDDALETFGSAVDHAVNSTSPGFMAYIPGGGLYAAGLASFLAAATNRYVGMWGMAPGITRIELDVVRWLCELFGYGPGSGGVLTTGGSLANLSAVVTARVARLGEDFSDGVIYVTRHTHASVAKGAAIAGFPARSIRSVPIDDRRRMRPDALQQAVLEDRAAGRCPFLVVASAGTADTGSVDPIDAVADVCEQEELWLHVDAAYGGFFRLTERGRATLGGIERADSITLDPHKGMFLPYGTGSVIVREGRLLREAHYSGAHYLQDLAGEEELPNFSEYGPELSRDFRGLRVWLPLRLHGVNAFREALDEKLDLARLLFEGLSAVPQLKLPWEPALTVVPFRLNAEGGDVEAANDRDRSLLERVNASKRVFLSSTMVDGRFTLRACILCLRTHRDRVEECVDIVREAAAELAR